MALNATARRRWLGALVLGAALVMLLLGETVLKTRLGAVGLLFYWLACFALTIVAIVVAFLDVRALQNQTRREQRDLLESTLKQIEQESERRGHRQSQKRWPDRD